jgi:L-ectoine synthase
MIMACCFNPPVTGKEVHGPDGAYALEDDAA